MMTSSNGNMFRVSSPLCGEFTGPGEFPTKRPVTRSSDVFFDLRLNKRLSKQPWGWWFETPSWSLWRHCNVQIHQQTVIGRAGKVSHFCIAMQMSPAAIYYSIVIWCLQQRVCIPDINKRPRALCLNQIKSHFKTELERQYTNKWLQEINDREQNPILRTYAIFKENHCLTTYIQCLSVKIISKQSLVSGSVPPDLAFNWGDTINRVYQWKRGCVIHVTHVI